MTRYTQGDSTELVLEETFSLFDRVSSFQVLKLKGELARKATGIREINEADALVVSFKVGKVAVLAFDVIVRRLHLLAIFNFESDATGLGAHVRASASVRLPTGASGQGIVKVDPNQRCLAMVMYEDQLAVLPLATFSESRGMLGFGYAEEPEEEDDEEALEHRKGYVSSVKDRPEQKNLGDIDFVTDYSSRLFRPPFIIPFSEIGEGIVGETKDFCYLRGYIDPTIAILHEPVPTNSARLTYERHTCQLTAVTLDLETGRHPVVWTVPNLPHDALCLVPVDSPIGGVIVLCTNAILYLSQQQVISQGLNGFAPTTTYHHSRVRLQPPPEDISIELDCVRWEWISVSQLLLTIQEGYAFVVCLQREEDSNFVEDILVRDTGLALNTVQCITSTLNRWFFFGSLVSDSLLLTIMPQTIFSAAEKLRYWMRLRKLDWKRYLRNNDKLTHAGDFPINMSNEDIITALQGLEQTNSESNRAAVAREICSNFRVAMEEEISARTGGVLACGRSSVPSSLFTSGREVLVDGSKLSPSDGRFDTANELVFMTHDVLSVVCAVGDTSLSLTTRRDAEDKQLPAAPRPWEMVTTCGNRKDGGVATFSRSLRGTVLSRLTTPECVGIWTLPVDIDKTAPDINDLTYPPQYVGAGNDYYDPELGEFSIPWMHQLIIVTTPRNTRILQIQNNKIEEATQDGTDFLLDYPTIAAGTLFGGKKLIQISTTGIRVINNAVGESGFCEFKFNLARQRGGFGLKDGEYVKRAHICDPYVALEYNIGSAEILTWSPDTEQLESVFTGESEKKLCGSEIDPIVSMSLYRDNGKLENSLRSENTISSKSMTFEPEWLHQTLQYYEDYFLQVGKEEAIQTHEENAEKADGDKPSDVNLQENGDQRNNEESTVNSQTPDEDYDSEDEGLYDQLGSNILDFDRLHLGEYGMNIALGDEEEEEKALYGEDGAFDPEQFRSSRKRDRSVQIDLSYVSDSLAEQVHNTTVPSKHPLKKSALTNADGQHKYSVYAVVCRQSGLVTVRNLDASDDHHVAFRGVADGQITLTNVSDDTETETETSSTNDEVDEVSLVRFDKLTLIFRMSSGIVYVYQGNTLPSCVGKTGCRLTFSRTTQHVCDANPDQSTGHGPCVFTEDDVGIELPKLHPFSNLCDWRGVAVLGRRPCWILEQRGALKVLPLEIPDVGPAGVHRSNLAGPGQNPLDVTPMQIKEGMDIVSKLPPGSCSARDYPVVAIAPLNSFLSRNAVLMALPGQASCCVMHLPQPHTLHLHEGAVSTKSIVGCGIQKVTFLKEGSRVPGTSTATIQPPSVQQWQKQKSLLAQSGKGARMRMQSAWQDAAIMENDDQTATAGTSVMSYIRETFAQSKQSSAAEQASSWGGELKSSPLFACLVSYNVPRDIEEEQKYEEKRKKSLGTEYVQLDFGEHKELCKPDPHFGGQPFQTEAVYEMILARRQRDLVLGEQLTSIPGTDGVRSWAPYSHYDDIITDEEAHTHEVSTEERIQLKREKSESLKKTSFEPVQRDPPETVTDLYTDELFDPEFGSSIKRNSMDPCVFNKLISPSQRRANPQILSDPSDFVCIDRFPLMRYEHGLVVREAALADAPGARKESFVIVGTGFVSPRAEDEDGQGRLIVFKIAYVNADIEATGSEATNTKQTVLVPRLKYLLDYDQEAPVSAVSCITVEGRDYIVIAAGRLIEIHKWEYGRLHKVGFYDAAIYPTDLTTVKNYILTGDLFQSVRLLCWRPKQWDLSLLAKDTSPSHTLSCSTFVHGDKLGLVATDMDQNLMIFTYEPKSGTRLFCKGDIHLSSPIMGATPVRLLRGSIEEQQLERQSKKLRYGVAFSTLDGGISMLIPLEHDVYQRLLMLQKLLNYAIQHTSGVNPRQAR